MRAQTKHDGGCAFPVPYGPDGQPGYSEGMTLRDWFAGQALAGMLTEGPIWRRTESAARYAYQYADAMLEAREEATS